MWLNRANTEPNARVLPLWQFIGCGTGFELLIQQHDFKENGIPGPFDRLKHYSSKLVWQKNAG
jgi:hypothetical protein